MKLGSCLLSSRASSRRRANTKAQHEDALEEMPWKTTVFARRLEDAPEEFARRLEDALEDSRLRSSRASSRRRANTNWH